MKRHEKAKPVRGTRITRLDLLTERIGRTAPSSGWAHDLYISPFHFTKRLYDEYVHPIEKSRQLTFPLE